VYLTEPSASVVDIAFNPNRVPCFLSAIFILDVTV
jgi:hypothetical protein